MYKKLRLLFLSLVIISMVFTLVYKVGHCASDSSEVLYFESMPYIVENNVGASGLISEAVILRIVDYVLTYDTLGSSESLLIVPYGDSNNYHIAAMIPNSSPNIFDDYVGNYILYYRVSYDFDSSGNFISSVSNAAFRIYLNNALEYINNRYVYRFNYFSDSYPVYVRNPQNYRTTNNTQVFTNRIGGHHKGGSIADIIDSIEDSSELPQVDDSSPSDSSSLPAWLQKILSALKSINSNLRGIGVSIVSGIGELIDKISEFCENIWDWIQNKFNNFIDNIGGVISDYNDLKDTDVNDVITALDNSIIFGGFSTFKGYLSTLDSIFNVSASESAPVWRIPLNGTVLYSSRLQYIDIDFSFFDRFHDVWLAFISLVFGFGMIFHILKSIPGIFHGLPGSHDVNNLTQPTMHTPPVKNYNTFVSGDLIKNYRSK